MILTSSKFERKVAAKADIKFACEEQVGQQPGPELQVAKKHTKNIPLNKFM